MNSMNGDCLKSIQHSLNYSLSKSFIDRSIEKIDLILQLGETTHAFMLKFVVPKNIEIDFIVIVYGIFLH
jgi:hypothetical protein